MGKKWDTIELLSHSRHDWLNKIQLIKGNLSLNKMDRVKEVIDEIVLEARQESKLSNLGIPQFAALLLTYNWEGNSVHLEFEVLDGTLKNGQKIDDGQLTNWTREFLNSLQHSIKEFHENHLSITIEIQETGIGFFFDFRGIITNIARLNTYLTESSSIDRKILELGSEELSIEVFFPFE